MLADVNTAFLHGDARRSLYVEMSPEDPTAASGRYVGKLERAKCGTRDASMIWQDHLRKTQLDMKFKESVTHPGVFQHETRDIFLCVHVDDLLRTGLREDLMWLKKQLLKEYEMEIMLMGEMTTWRRNSSISVEHWNAARTIEDMCVHCCVSWEWRIAEVSPRH